MKAQQRKAGELGEVLDSLLTLERIAQGHASIDVLLYFCFLLSLIYPVAQSSGTKLFRPQEPSGPYDLLD